MKLLTKELEKAFEKVGCQDDVADPLVVAKFFNPTGGGTWLAMEYWPEGKVFFGYVSLFNDDLLQEVIRTSVDQNLVQAMADAAAEDRMLELGATNLDFGIGRIFDMGHEATEALASSC